MDDLSVRQRDSLFQALPTPTMLLDIRLIIRAVNPAYESATLRQADDLLGVPLFEAFPDNPDDPDGDGVANLGSSLARVAQSRRPHRMLVQRYDIVDSRDGSWTRRVWRPQNSPLVEDGRVVGLVHQVQDVTGDDLAEEIVNLRRQDCRRATIDQARGIIMADRRCGAEEASAVLAALSAETNVDIAKLAQELVAEASAAR